MTLIQAAKQLNIHPATLRKWIARGCPTVSLGEVGRGHGSEVDLHQIQLWRAQQAVPSFSQAAHNDTLQLLTVALLDTLKRDDLAARVGLTDPQAYMACLLIYERFYKNLTHEPLTADILPPELKPFGAIVLHSMESGSFITSRRT
jgi:hypothetical protein